MEHGRKLNTIVTTTVATIVNETTPIQPTAFMAPTSEELVARPVHIILE